MENSAPKTLRVSHSPTTTTIVSINRMDEKKKPKPALLY
jgi:hypothetical protein